MKNKLLTVLLALTFIKGLIWAALTPIFQAPDEPIHFAMTQYLGETNQHPGKVKVEINSLEFVKVLELTKFNWAKTHPVWQGLPKDWVQQINQMDPSLADQFKYVPGSSGGQKLPQLYYWLNWPVYKLFNNQSFFIRFYALRIASVFLGVATVYFSFLIAKLFFNNKSLALAVASLVAFQPMISVIFSSITYDSLAILTATIFTFFSISFIKTKKNKYLWSALLVSLVSLFVKTQLIALLLTWPFLLSKKQLKKLVIFAPLLILVSTVKDYKEIISHFFSWFSAGPILTHTTQYLTQNFSRMWAEIFPWYWGVFGWLEAVMPLRVYTLLKLITLFSLIGLFKFGFKQLKSKTQLFKKVKFLLLFSLLVIAVVLANDFIIFTQRLTIFGVQGRYFLPAITASMILLVFGFVNFLPSKHHQLLSKLIIIFSLTLNLIGLYSLYQYFGNVWL